MSAAVTVTLLVAGTFGGGAAAAPLPLTGGSATTSTSQDVCGTPAPGYLRCLAIRKTDASEPAGLSAHANAGVVPNVTPRGYGPSDLAAAYQLDPNGGSGQTVALVDAFDSPTVESDLAVYRAQYGLPACTTLNSCFRKVNQAGAASPLPAANSGWAAEIALDVEMVSAVCPQCNILLVEARTNYTSDLGSAVDTAVALGAKFVSNSYGGGDSTSQGSHFDHPGVAITASTGDNGYGVSFPASVPTVTAVGGTSLTRAATSRGWAESTWSGSGSGCSGAWGKPAIQTLVNTGCTNRAVADVSAVADPNTGVAVYDAGSWMVLGGTSASSPIIAAVYALAGTPGAGDYPNTYPYEYSDSVNDVTVGSNGTCGGSALCTARAGWDGPTGLGTPSSAAAFSASGVVGPPTKLGAALTVNNPAIPGIGTRATVTPILPDGHSVTSIRWKAARTDCVFNPPSSTTTTVTCPAKASGTTTVTATVVDSAQASRAVTVPLVFNTSGAKRDLAVTFGLAGQSGSSQSVCTSASTPVVATVTDAATGSPVMGIPVSFSRQTGSLNPVGLPGANTGADGRATVSISTATPLTLASRTTAVGPFNAFAGSSFGITASRCTPDLTATTNLTSTYYGDPVTVTGTLTRALGTGVVPVGGAGLQIVQNVAGRTVVLGRPTTAADGSFTCVVRPTASGILSVTLAASPSWTAAAASTDSLTVSLPLTSMSAAMSGSDIGYAAPLSASGTLFRDAGGSLTSLAGGTVQLKITSASGAIAVLGSTRVAADGTWRLTVLPRLSGTVSASYAGAPGQPAATTTLGALTVGTWASSVTLAAQLSQQVAGAPNRLTGTVSRGYGGTNGPAPGVLVRVYLVTTTGATPIIGTATTTAAGTFALTVAPTENGTLVAKVVSVTGYSDSASAPVNVATSTRVSGSAPVFAGTGGTFLFSISVAAPRVASVSVQAWDGSNWNTVASATTTAAGLVRVPLAAGSVGKYTLRATVTGDSRGGDGVSNNVVVTVR